MLTGIMAKVTEQGQQMAKLGVQLNEVRSAKQEPYAFEIMKTIRSRPGGEDHVGVNDGEEVTEMTHKKAPRNDEPSTTGGDDKWATNARPPNRVPSNAQKSKDEDAQCKNHCNSRSYAEHDVSVKGKPIGI